jgi:PAS domain S-box-containing protein
LVRTLNRWLIIAIIVIIASGMLLTIWSIQQQENRLRADLISKTHIIQGGISTGQVRALTGTEADLLSPDYQTLKAQMIQVQSADPMIRFIHLMGQKPDGTVFFFIDPEPEESGYYSPPGQVYPEASSIVLNVFASGEETTGGPVTDRWGTWMSGLVPIRDSSTGKVIAVLVTDIHAQDWNTQIIIASIPAVIAMLLLLLLLLIFFYVQQRNSRERQILTSSENAIKESERRLTDIINFLPDATMVIDTDRKVISWNKAIEEMTGVPAEDILGKGNYEYSVPFYGERRPVLIDLVFEEEEEIKKNYPFVQKNGDKFFSEIYIQRLFGGRGAYLWFIASPLYDIRGNIIGAIETIRDITGRKLVENELRESEESFRMLFEESPVPIYITEIPSGTITSANTRFLNYIDMPPDQIIGKRISDLGVLNDPADHERLNVASMANSSVDDMEVMFVNRQGIKSITLVSTRVVTLKKKRYCLTVVQDITELKVLEEQMVYTNSEVNKYAADLRQTNDKLNLLNSITRHDILNQLTVVLGYLEMMKAKFPDPSLQDYIKKEIHAAQNIQTQILFTKEYQEIGVQSPQWFDLKKVIMVNAASLPLSTVEVVVDFDNLELYADPLLEKVFYTLLENAIRHGKTVTRIDFSYRTQGEDLVVVYEDNGVGIPAEYKKAILQRKYFKHTGFGLYLSQTILGITGVSLEENGEPGKGARFEILVPTGTFRFTDSEQ